MTNILNTALHVLAWCFVLGYFAVRVRIAYRRRIKWRRYSNAAKLARSPSTNDDAREPDLPLTNKNLNTRIDSGFTPFARPSALAHHRQG